MKNHRIDARTQECLEQFAAGDREAIGRARGRPRLSLSGVLLTGLVSRRFAVLPAAIFGSFFQHATQGWCPPLPVFPKMGVRTRREINKEKYALKALRGDCNHMPADRRFDQGESS